MAAQKERAAAQRCSSPLHASEEDLDWAQLLWEIGDETMLNIEIPDQANEVIPEVEFRDIPIDEVSLRRHVNNEGNNNGNVGGNDDIEGEEEEPEEEPEEDPEEDPSE